MHQNQHKKNHHIPVLLDHVLKYLDPRPGETYLDLTAGYGGHAAAILEETHNRRNAVLVDRDIQAVEELQKQFGEARVIHSDFLAATERLRAEGQTFDIIFADLGVSSPHLDNASRGFSISQTGPLDMRMDIGQELTAAGIVNHASFEELVRILRDYGEEPKAVRIARLIIEHRPIETTTQLASIVAKAWPGKANRTHPATRTFQALRITVNDELEMLKRALPLWIELLSAGGRIGVISFHSLEDRAVKQAFSEVAGDRYDASLKLLTNRPITGDATELVSNPRARSAKFRAAAKINI